jgi:hypothetical protein
MIYQSNPTSNGVHRANAPLDIMFIQDVTESQQRYIDTARNGITQIYNTLAPQDLRLGLIAFRDHPPQEHSFLTQEYPFTSDFGSFASNLANLRAEGGGDEPDAQTDALAAACNADWRAEARKIVVLVTIHPHLELERTETPSLKGAHFKLTRSVLRRTWEELASLCM